jgi:hypothetical protein
LASVAFKVSALVSLQHPSQRTTAPSCLPLGIKDSLKEDAGLFCLRLLLFGFLMGKAFGLRLFALCFWLFGVGDFWKGKELWREIAKRGIAKEGLIESLLWELYT